nr:HK97 family phage prohead protease [Brevibacillus laterosporus]
MQRGDVDGGSFGFHVRKDAWTYLKDEDVYERTLTDINLAEISPTPFPAYESSEVNQRSIEQFEITIKEQRKDKTFLLLALGNDGVADIKIKNVEVNQKQPLKAKIQLKTDKKEFYLETENFDSNKFDSINIQNAIISKHTSITYDDEYKGARYALMLKQDEPITTVTIDYSYLGIDFSTTLPINRIQ